MPQRQLFNNKTIKVGCVNYHHNKQQNEKAANMCDLKKRVVLSIVMALLCLGSFAATSGVTFLMKNGAKVCFAFSAKPVISVASDGVTVSAQGQSDVSYLFSDVDRFYFVDDVETAIKDIKTDATASSVFNYDNGIVSVGGLAAGERVAVCSLGGSKVGDTKADHVGSASIDISGVPTGVYVVSAGKGVSFKLLKK